MKYPAHRCSLGALRAVMKGRDLEVAGRLPKFFQLKVAGLDSEPYPGV